MSNPLQDLRNLGQSFWLDYIDRDLLDTGGLKRLVDEDGLRGVTSNPSIFEKAVTGSTSYDAALSSYMTANPGIAAKDLFEHVGIRDIRDAADVLRPVYDASDGADGFVSLEVSPHLAYDTEGTISNGLRLWGEVNRPNLMIKVPAAPQGFPAVEELIAQGVNVNVTLMFSLEQYEAAARAYTRGVARLADPTRAASVSSFFVSRVDSKVDALLDAIGTEQALALCGKAAVANARQAFQLSLRLAEEPEFQAQAARGARPQRLLWASTSTKNPAYPATLYVDELVGPNTVNTMPPATVDAFRSVSSVQSVIGDDPEGSAKVLSDIAALGVDFQKVHAELLDEGVDAFIKAYDGLLAAAESKARAAAGLATAST